MSLDDFDDEVAVAELDTSGPPLHWPSLEDEALTEAQTELTIWVEQLVARFDIKSNAVPNCWNRHNGTVEALQGLRDFERGSYADDASPSQGVEFIKATRDVLEMCTEWTNATGCASTHREPVAPRTWATDPAGWDVDRAPSTFHVVSS